METVASAGHRSARRRPAGGRAARRRRLPQRSSGTAATRPRAASSLSAGSIASPRRRELLSILAWDRDKLEPPRASRSPSATRSRSATGSHHSSRSRHHSSPGQKKLGTRGELHSCCRCEDLGTTPARNRTSSDRWVKHNRDQAYRYLESRNIGRFPFPESGDTGRARRTLDVGSSGAGAAYRKRHEQAMHMALWRRREAGRDRRRHARGRVRVSLPRRRVLSRPRPRPARLDQGLFGQKVPGFDKKLPIGWLTSKIHHGSWGVAKRVGAAMFLGGRIETLVAPTELWILMTGFGFGDVVSLVAHDAESARRVTETHHSGNKDHPGRRRGTDRARGPTSRPRRVTTRCARRATPCARASTTSSRPDTRAGSRATRARSSWAARQRQALHHRAAPCPRRCPTPAAGADRRTLDTNLTSRRAAWQARRIDRRPRPCSHGT